MSKIQLPPKKDKEVIGDKPLPKVSERKIQEIINKGGSPIAETSGSEEFKNFNLILLKSDLNKITELCGKRPKKHGRKIGISKLDWLLEAVQEKIEREERKYNI